jgi:hypothetical protein
MSRHKRARNVRVVPFDAWQPIFLSQVTGTAISSKHWNDVKRHFRSEARLLKILYHYTIPGESKEIERWRGLLLNIAGSVGRLKSRLESSGDEIFEAYSALSGWLYERGQYREAPTPAVDPLITISLYQLSDRAQAYEKSLRRMASKRTIMKKHFIVFILELLRRRIGHVPAASFATVLEAGYFAHGLNTPRDITPNGLERLHRNFRKRHPALDLLLFE